MGIIQRQSIKSMVIAYIGVLLGFINLVILMPRILTPDQVGLVRVLLDVAIIYLTFSQLGLPTLTVKFFPWFRDQQKKFYGFLNFELLIALVGFTGIGLVFYFLKAPIEQFYAKKSSLLNEYLYLSYGFAFFMLLFVVFEAYARALFKIVMPNFLRDNLVRASVTLLLIGVYFSVVNFNQFLLGYIIAYAVSVLGMILYLKKLNVWFISEKPAIFKHPKFKEMLPFAVFVIFAGASGMVQAKIDTLMITGLVGLSYTAVYSIAFFMATAIELPRRSIGQIAIPFVAQAWKDENLEKINLLYKKTALNQMVAGLGLFLLVWLNIDSILLFLPEIYRTGKWVILFIGLARVIDMSMGINTEILATSKYYKWDLPLKILLIVLSIILNFYWIPIWGINGAALATLAAFVIYNILRAILLWQMFKFIPFTFGQLKCLIIALLTFGLVFYLPSIDHFIIDIIFKSMLISILYGGGMVYFKVSEDINQAINNILQKIKR